MVTSILSYFYIKPGTQSSENVCIWLVVPNHFLRLNATRLLCGLLKACFHYCKIKHANRFFERRPLYLLACGMLSKLSCCCYNKQFRHIFLHFNLFSYGVAWTTHAYLLRFYVVISVNRKGLNTMLRIDSLVNFIKMAQNGLGQLFLP